MNKNWMESRYTLGSIVARSNAMTQIMPEAQKAANDSTRLLIVGEIGVGKKTLARAIHYSGNRAKKPFVSIPCERLTPDSVDRILFGDNSSSGILEEAAEGTLVLSGLEDLGPIAQDRILTVLREESAQDKECESRLCNIRMIATANVEEFAQVLADGSFLVELHELLSEATIEMPALEQREADLPYLVNDILKEFAVRERIETPSVPFHYMDLLTKVAWPENARQLRNHLESVMALSEGNFDPEILLAHFEEIEAPQTIRAAVHNLLSKLNGESNLASAMNS
ncbi:sigma 54-interacting transcriptional regulator [bacterium]|nr:sigma 54-interacting transcriptional regulator [bacterium]